MNRATHTRKAIVAPVAAISSNNVRQPDANCGMRLGGVLATGFLLLVLFLFELQLVQVRNARARAGAAAPQVTEEKPDND